MGLFSGIPCRTRSRKQTLVSRAGGSRLASLVVPGLALLIAAGIGSAMRPAGEGPLQVQSTLSKAQPIPMLPLHEARSDQAARFALDRDPVLTRLLHPRLRHAAAYKRLRARKQLRRRAIPKQRLRRRSPLLVHVSTTTYTSNTTWTLANSPYVLDGDVTVATGATLTIEPGVIVKFNGQSRTMNINGTLNAVGTSTSPITFTSYKDDTAGGDTNGDGSATTGAPGQWYDIWFRSSVSQLTFVTIRYGGWGTAQSYAPIYATGSGHSVSLNHATITNNLKSAVVVSDHAAATISNSTLSNNNYGLYVDTATATVDHTTIANNSARGVWFNLTNVAPTPAASSITSSDITGNTSYGIFLNANGDYPLASMPRGIGDNIYASNANGTQLYVTGFPSFKNADVNWRGNYWGDNVYHWYGGGGCAGSAPNSAGHLAYRSSGGNVPAGPISSGSYMVGGSWCGYDSFAITPCDFYPTKLDGSPHLAWCQTFGSANGKNPTRTLADPVNSATGGFEHAEADLALPGVGVPFSFTRSYNSLDVTKGELGQGWTNSLAASLITKSNGDVTVHGDDGQQLAYTKQLDGSFIGGAGSLSTLATVAGGYDLTRADQVKQHFDSQGRLLSVLDRNGQGLTLAYGGDGKLATVTDAAGRVISFTHNASGLLTQITMPDTSSVSFGYTNGQLTSYTDQRAKVWTYSYDSHGFLVSETDPLAHTQFQNSYGPDGRVTQQLDALNQATTFSWDPATQTQTVTDPRGNSRKDVYASNVLVKRIDAVGNTTELAHNTSLDATSSTLPTGATTTMTYDARGNMLTATAPPSLGNATKTFTYDANNNLVSVTDARGKVTTYGYDANGNNTSVVQDGHTISETTYNAAGQPTSRTDGNGQTTTYTYDVNGNLTSETDPLGHKTSYSYDTAGRVLTKVDPRGNEAGANPADFTTSYTYDATGNKLSETDPLGHTTTYTYDAAGNRTSITDPLGNTTTYLYDNRNELSSMTGPDPDGGGPLVAPLTTYTYDVAGNQLTVTDPLGHTTTKTYDQNKRLASVTTSLGEKTTYTYDANGNLASVVDPRGNAVGANPADYRTSYTYDAAGRRLTETDPLGHTTTNAYDLVGNLMSITDGDGHQTTKSYDGQNRLSSVTAPDGGVTSYTYDGAGNQLTETDPLNHVTTSAYDAAAQLTSSTTPLGHTTSYSYDANGNKLTTTDPLGHVAADSYDRVGRLLSETDPLGHATSYAYDANGNRLSTTDANSHETSYAYDPLGRLTSVTAPDGGVTSYTYDAAGNTLTRTDANGHSTSYTYDGDNRQSSVTAPLGRVWTYGYDAASNQTVTVDANGNATQSAGDGTTTRSYDPNNRLTGITYSDSTPAVTFAYDGVGNRLSMVDGSGTVSYIYDSTDRLTQVNAGGNSFSYGYDFAGRLTSRTYPDGTVVTNIYDADSNLASLTSGSATTSYGYNAAGQLTTTTLPASNGYIETRSYDAAGRVTEVANTKGALVLSDFAYTLDPVGNPTRIVRTGTLNETATFSYEANDRLTRVCYQESCPNASDPYIGYTYDGVGNRVTETRPSGTTSYSYDAGDELTDAGGVSYGYDRNGNEILAGTRTFTYDLANRVASTTSGGVTTDYTYDGDGNRTRATSGSSTTNYLWDTSGDLAELALERDGAGALLRRYIYGNRRISLTDGSGTSYYHYDSLGSVMNVTSQVGATQWTYSYEPFGGMRTQTQVDPQAPVNLMKFAGELTDPVGLYYLRARLYDSVTGRFLAPDPMPALQDDPMKAAYIYADDRPTLLTDPTGMHTVDDEGQWGAPPPGTPPPTIPVTPAPVGPSLDAYTPNDPSGNCARFNPMHGCLWGVIVERVLIDDCNTRCVVNNVLAVTIAGRLSGPLLRVGEGVIPKLQSHLAHPTFQAGLRGAKAADDFLGSAMKDAHPLFARGARGFAFLGNAWREAKNLKVPKRPTLDQIRRWIGL